MAFKFPSSVCRRPQVFKKTTTASTGSIGPTSRIIINQWDRRKLLRHSRSRQSISSSWQTRLRLVFVVIDVPQLTTATSVPREYDIIIFRYFVRFTYDFYLHINTVSSCAGHISIGLRSETQRHRQTRCTWTIIPYGGTRFHVQGSTVFKRGRGYILRCLIGTLFGRAANFSNRQCIIMTK